MRASRRRHHGSPARRFAHGAHGVALALAGAAGSTAAQVSVTGEVTDASTGSRLAYVLVVLETSDGEEVTQTLSARDGRYRLGVPEAGEWRISARSLGYASTTSERLEIREPEVEFDFELAPEPIDLDPVAVRAAAAEACEPMDEVEGTLLVSLWEEALKALDVVAHAEAEERYRFHLEERQRAVDLFTGDIIEDDEARSEAGQAFRSAPVEELVEDGWVQAGDLPLSSEFYGPDARAVLSPEFQRRYCFGIREAELEEDEGVGITFAPMDPGDEPDVTGVLWVDPEDGAPRELHFEYTHYPLDPPLPDALRPFFGGEVAFGEAEEGLWVVEDWVIRVPRYEMGLAREAPPVRTRELIEPFRQAQEDIPSSWIRRAWQRGLVLVEEGGSVVSVHPDSSL